MCYFLSTFFLGRNPSTGPPSDDDDDDDNDDEVINDDTMMIIECMSNDSWYGDGRRKNGRD